MNRFRRGRNEEESARERRVPLFVPLAALLLYFIRFGYDYANSDQDEILPYLLHRMDRGLFTQDWFVGIQVSEFSVRTYFVWLLNLFAFIFPVWLTVLLLYVVSWLLIAGAIYKITYHFTRDQLAACAAILLALVFTPVWTLGGNDLVHGMLVASMFGWALGLWAVYHFLRLRYLLVPVLLGVACWIQPLVGLHLAMLLILVRVLRFVRDREAVQTIGGILVFGVLFVLWASPSLGPIMYQQVLEPATRLNSDSSLFYILAEFRLPHHYLPGSFYLHNVARFALLGVASAAALLWKPYSRHLDDRGFIVRSIVLIAMFGLVAWIFTEIVPVLFVAKLQFFKMTVFAKLLFIIVISGAVFFWLPVPLLRPLKAVLQHPRWGLALTAIAWVAVIAVTVHGSGYLHERVGPFRRAGTPLGVAQEWARHQTRVDAIFTVPPSLSSFRSEAHRTIIINYKAVPYEDELMVTWFERLTDMAPIELPQRGGPDLLDRLDAAYESLDGQRLADLSTKYEFNYVLRRTSLVDPDSAFHEAFSADGWFIYEREKTVQADSVATSGSGDGPRAANPDSISSALQPSPQ